MGKVSDKGVFSPRIYSTCTASETSKHRGTRHRSENGRKKNKQFKNADDTTLLAESKEELLQLVTSVKEKSAQAGLYLNLKRRQGHVY